MTEDIVNFPGFGGHVDRFGRGELWVEFWFRMGTNMGMKVEQIMTTGMP